MTHTGSVSNWRARAACLGHWDEMHPENNVHEIEHAKSICRPCPVRVACLRDAIRTGDNQWGIRAGLRPNERRAVALELERRKTAAQTEAAA